jgi:uncharacterized protein YmfQ (DUF2313 family)
MRTPQQVLADLLAYSPPGDELPLADQPGDMWPLWLLPMATEISRFEGLAEDQVEEVDPRDATYLLGDYIRMLGPDPYGRDSVPLTTSQEQLLAYQRLTSRGGQSIQYFIDLAAAFGVAITITEGTVTVCGSGRAGNVCSVTPQQFYWLVTLPETEVIPAVCGAAVCGDLMGAIAASPVVPVIERDQPAHGQVVFSYTAGSFGPFAIGRSPVGGGSPIG